MVLEANVLILDNSEWMRNGDIAPSRLEAQNDAVQLIFTAKTQSNPENTVGLMSMAGLSPQVHVTLTNDLGKVLVALHSLKPQGRTSVSQAVQVAQLMLKHRQNKNQRQRIIVFVGSPVDEDEKALVRLGKRLKKNNVAVDVVLFGSGEEVAANQAKLQALIESTASNDNSHLITVPPGPHHLSDFLISTPVIQGEDGSGMGTVAGAGGASGGFEFGIDPSLDPELALALRLSMEEERSRQEAATSSSAPQPPAAVSEKMAGVEQTATGAEMEEDAMLAQAIAMSMAGDKGEDVEMTSSSTEQKQKSDMNAILSSLPGVDPNDERFKNALSATPQPSNIPKPDSKEAKSPKQQSPAKSPQKKK